MAAVVKHLKEEWFEADAERVSYCVAAVAEVSNGLNAVLRTNEKK